MSNISSVCVYCASSSQVDSIFVETARHLGTLLAQHGITCVNGGGKVGLMGTLSNAVLAHGGRVEGVIPRFMVDNGWQHDTLSALHVTEGMHTRKQLMADMADGCIVLPGGVGTLEELAEVVTWKQLGLYKKPVVILNTAGYYAPLLEMFGQMVEKKFMRPLHAHIWQVAQTPDEALQMLLQAAPWPQDYGKYAAF